MNVAVLLPTYNEKDNITKLILKLQKEIIPAMNNHSINIIVADDNSPDDTGKIVTELAGQWSNIFLCNGEKQGIGAAFSRAMSFAVKEMNSDVFIEMDADGQHDPNKIPEMLYNIEKGYDLVIGSRYIPGGSIPKHWHPARKFLSVVGNIATSISLGEYSVHDWTNSFRAINKSVFLSIKDKVIMHKGNTFLPAFLYEAIKDGFKVTEIPIIFGSRITGHSKIVSQEYIIELSKYIFNRKIKDLKN